MISFTGADDADLVCSTSYHLSCSSLSHDSWQSWLIQHSQARHESFVVSALTHQLLLVMQKLLLLYDVWCVSGCTVQNITTVDPQRRGLIQRAQGSHHTGTQKQHEGKVTAKLVQLSHLCRITRFLSSWVSLTSLTSYFLLPSLICVPNLISVWHISCSLILTLTFIAIMSLASLLSLTPSVFRLSWISSISNTSITSNTFDTSHIILLLPLSYMPHSSHLLHVAQCSVCIFPRPLCVVSCSRFQLHVRKLSSPTILAETNPGVCSCFHTSAMCLASCH